MILLKASAFCKPCLAGGSAKTCKHTIKTPCVAYKFRLGYKCDRKRLSKMKGK